MKKVGLLWILALVVAFAPSVRAESQQGEHGHETMSHEKGMTHGTASGTFSHQEVVDGIRAAFQVMSLAQMNMSDPEGNTHHIMVQLTDEKTGQPLGEAVGKIKVIAPSGKEQTATLKNYNGIFAANFKFPEKGKYGVICLFKEGKEAHVVKFWYSHEM